MPTPEKIYSPLWFVVVICLLLSTTTISLVSILNSFTVIPDNNISELSLIPFLFSSFHTSPDILYLFSLGLSGFGLSGSGLSGFGLSGSGLSGSGLSGFGLSGSGSS